MGAGDQYVEVRVTYVLPEGTDELTWDVRCRTAGNDSFRLYDMDSVELAEPVLNCPGLRAVEQLLERWLSAAGVQLSLPFS